MAEPKSIAVARSDKIVLHRVEESDGRVKFLRTCTTSIAPECERLHHGAMVARLLYIDEIDQSIDWAFVSGEALDAYEGYVPRSSLLLSELCDRRGKLPDLDILRIMRNVVKKLHRCFHSRGILHGDIRLESILLLDLENLTVCLTSLEYSSQESPLRATSSKPIPSSSIFTAAPENSGRLPHLVDERSDLYSVGVAMYQLFSGVYPFQGSSVSEILHGHIAKQPADLAPEVPSSIRSMIYKLLSKTPEKRYQSAQSLLADIDSLIVAMEVGDVSLRDVAIGQIDDLSRSLVEECFVGRTSELAKLVNTLQTVKRDHKTRNVFIKGGSGSGKSALVNRLFREIPPGTTLRGACKVNQTSTTHVGSLSSVKALISDLIKQSVFLPIRESRQLVVDLVSQLSDELVPLAQLSPELLSFLGDRYEELLASSQAYEISPASLEARIQTSILRFFQVFATADVPLILFVDDLQWASPQDLDVLLGLTKDTKNILLVITYREGEITQATTDSFFKHVQPDLILHLEALNNDDAYMLLSASLRREGSDVRELADIICAKTVHNLFYFRQFLQSLLEAGYVYFNFATKRWEIEIASVEAVQPAADVVVFILERLAQIDESAMDVLTACACLARPTIDLAHVLMVCGMPDIEVYREMNTLCSMGLLSRIKDEVQGIPSDSPPPSIYQFSHDKIQQSSWQLIPVSQRTSKRFGFGKTLLSNLNIEEAPPNVIFEICGLLMEGVSEGRRDEPVDGMSDMLSLFILAAEMSNQPDSRLTYLKFAKLLKASNGDSLHLKLDESLLDAYVAVGNREESLRLIKDLQLYELETAAQIRLIQKEAKIHWLDLHDADVRRLGQAGLRLAGFDVDFSAQPDVIMPMVMDFISRIPQTVAEINAFENHTVMKDEILLASQSLLVTIMPAIFFISANHLIALILTLGVSTVFEHGISTDGCYLLTFLGLTMCDICSPGYDYAKAKALADVALVLSERIRLQAQTRQEADLLATMYVLQGGVNIWSVNDRAVLTEIYTQAVLHTKRAFNSEYSAYSHTNAIGFYGILRGHSLRQLDALFGPRTCLKLIFRGDRATHLFALPTLQTLHILLYCQNLDEFSIISGDIVDDEAALEKELFETGVPAMHKHHYLRCKVLLALLSHDLSACKHHLSRLFEIITSIQGLPDWAFANIVKAFVYLLEPEYNPNDSFYSTFRQHLDVWAEKCSADFEATRLFFSAEEAFRAAGFLTSSTFRLYDSAIASMFECQNYLLAGLFSERAFSRVSDIMGKTAASGYLRTAREAFDEYGCPAKVRSLEELRPTAFDFNTRPRLDRSMTSNTVPTLSTVSARETTMTLTPPGQGALRTRQASENLLDVISPGSSRTAAAQRITSSQDVSKIDLTTVIEIAQLLNQEVDSVAIIEALLVHLLRSAGASLGVVVLLKNKELIISAIADQDGVRRFEEHSLEADLESDTLSADICASIRLAIQKGQSIYQRTSFLMETAESFLAVPLIYQSVTLGAVYLENRQIEGLFSNNTNSELIHVLVSQVASQLSRNKVIYALEQNKRELIVAKSALEDAVKMKDRFLSTISHELRTPFNSILGFVSLMMESGLTDKQHRMVDSIQSSSRNLLSIINGILDFSQIERGALQLHPKVFDLREMIRLTIESLSSMLGPRQLEILHLENPDGISHILLGDDGRIRQCLLVLLDNAIKYSFNNVIVIKTNVSYLANGIDVMLHLSVVDRGKGIAEKDIAKLFERFSQVDDSTTRNQEGIGMGLAISSGLVRLFNGDLSVKSVLGTGSTFTATFELKLVDVDSEPKTQRLLGDNLQILILDKIEERAHSMKNHLEALGMTGSVSITKSGPSSRLENAAESIDCSGIVAVIVSDTSNHAAYIEEIGRLVKSRKVPIFETRLFSSDTPEQENGIILLSVPINRDILLRILRKHIPSSTSVAPPKLRRGTSALKPVESLDRDEFLTVDLKVLTVDDNKINLKVAQGFLKREGTQTDTACDGIDAIDKIREKAYDLIFMDIQMPRMDGMECTKTVRQLYEAGFSGRPRPHIVALTANAIVGDRERYLAMGMDDYLSKPLDKLSLKEVLTRTRKGVAMRQNTAK